MAIHTQLPIYKTAYTLLDVVMDLVKNMPRDFKRLIGEEIANSYFGLLRQAGSSHVDRARLANVLRHRGHCIKADLTKTYRRHHGHPTSTVT